MVATGPDCHARVTIPIRGPFSLGASRRFLEGFTPAAHPGDTADHLHLAFPVENHCEAVGVCVSQPEADRDVVADLYGRVEVTPATVAAQLARILSLDVDGSAFEEVGDRDAVIADLQARTPGLRPVCFFSPYEAACWAIISHRTRIPQAATIKQQIADRYGTSVDIHGRPEPAFPGPHTLAEVTDQLDDLWRVKRGRLAQLADAALNGHLDAERLRAMNVGDALDHLQALPGIGPFSAELILLRGAGHPDHVPTHERRLLEAIGQLYGIDEPTVDDLRGLAEAWRPYRTWCAVLLRSWYEERQRDQP